MCSVCSRLAFGHMLLVVLVVSGVGLCLVLVCDYVVLCPVVVGECVMKKMFLGGLESVE
jgi:hypothetical protein